MHFIECFIITMNLAAGVLSFIQAFKYIELENETKAGYWEIFQGTGFLFLAVWLMSITFVMK